MTRHRYRHERPSVSWQARRAIMLGLIEQFAVQFAIVILVVWLWPDP
jgi:hypothetical protein